jgi:hypothetical protein
VQQHTETDRIDICEFHIHYSRNFSALYRISKWSIFISISKLLENLVMKN